MCGIAGIVSTDRNDRIESSTIGHMCRSLVHRGPDDEGHFVKDGAGLGARRLSIIDVEGGHQPIFNEDGSIWVVFNGEIYNFRELRAELESRGHRFRSHADTEVIVHLYEEFGANCVHKLRGMFAFAIYDERRRYLLLVRDRLGIKPLHYACVNGRLLFGSEIKAILAVAPELAVVNHSALLQYMFFGYVPDPATAFASIYKLPPGRLLEFAGGQLNVRQYWNLPPYNTHHPRSEGDCLEELEGQLTEAVRSHLVADVPLGAFLSGGTDSSTVVALMARASSGPVKTFSVGFRQADFNEAHHARLVAERFGTEHSELTVEPDVMLTLDTLTYALEEPFGDSSMLPTYFLSCLAGQHVRVALSGDGGDELFAGYDRYDVLLRRGDWIPPWAGRFYREQVHPRLPHSLRGRNLAYSACLPWQDQYLDEISLKPLDRELDLLSDDFWQSSEGEPDPFHEMREYLDNAPAEDTLSRVLYLDSKTYLPGDILTKVDRMSMATSLEVRVPVLDHVFLEWATGLAVDWKMRGRRQKYILRKLAEKVGVPRQVLHRPKKGFALPLRHWMKHELKEFLLSILLDARTLQRGYFNRKAVGKLLDEHFCGRRDHSHFIWRILMLELWHRNFLQGVRAPGLEAHTVPAGPLRGTG